jgi:hypothetical protein
MELKLRRSLGISTLLAIVLASHGGASPALATGITSLTWASPIHADPSPLLGVSCTSLNLCVAVDEAGDVLTSTEPVAGVWSKRHVEGSGALDGVSCTTPDLCVAIDNAGDVVSSTNPTGGVGAWSVVHVDGTNTLKSVSCPSASLCVAIDNAGDVVTSTEPAGAATAWKVTPTGDPGVSHVSCSSASLCVAIDDAGNVVTSTEPSKPATEAWTVTRVDGETPIDGVSCPYLGLCVAVDIDDRVLSATDPTAGASAWTRAYVEGPNGLQDVSCGSVSLCVATTYGGNGSDGNVIASSNPTGDAAAWSEGNVYGSPIIKPNPVLELYSVGLTGVSCVSASLCVVVDVDGRVIVGSSPPTMRPVNISLPMVTGMPVTGQALLCSEGSWSGEPALAYQWLRDGAPMTGVVGSAYIVQEADEGHSLACQVTASNAAGSASATSGALSIPRPWSSGSSGGGGRGGEVSVGGDLFRVAGIANFSRHGTVRVTLILPGPGMLKVVARASVPHVAKPRGTFLVAQMRAAVKGAGRIAATLTPTAKARLILARQGKLTASVTITYAPSGGGGLSRSIVRSVTFKLKRRALGPSVRGVGAQRS